jgi:signal transduction histidine kinase
VDNALREKNIALDQSVAQLRKLAMELTKAEEEERKRLASILHDHVQQYIAAANMNISLLDTRMSVAEHAQGVKKVLALLGEAMTASRSLTVSLCPPVLLEAGLMPGLSWLAEWMQVQHGLTVTVIGDGAQAVPASLNTFLFQAVRELLFNVVKHAGVKQASVVVEQPASDVLRLTVQDQGKGFPAGGSHLPPLSGGFGLFQLRERLTYMGGMFDVACAPSGGTRISITVPLA